MLRRATSWLLLPLLVSTALALPGLTTLWTLPLGIEVDEDTESLPFVTDGSVIYTADSRGVIFAVDAATAQVLWSSPGNIGVSNFILYPEIPDKLYVLTQVSISTTLTWTVQAMRRTDGAILGTLANLSDTRIAVTGTNLAILQNYSIVVTDQLLNVVWRRSPGPSALSIFQDVGANDHLIVTMFWQNYTAVMGNVVSFDAHSGEVVCNMSNVSDIFNQLSYVHLFLTPTNLTVLSSEVEQSPEGAYTYWRVMNMATCEEFRTRTINDAAIGGFSQHVLIHPTESGDLFVNMNLTNSSWIVDASPISESLTEGFQWYRVFDNFGQQSGVYAFPLVGKLPWERGGFALWVNTMLLALNDKTGETLWSLPYKIPALPSSQTPWQQVDSYLYYPLGAGRVLVPNLQGYIIANINSGDLEVVVQDNPSVFQTGALAPFMNASSRVPFVVYVAEDGSLVALQ